MALKVDIMDKVFNKMEWSFSYQFWFVLVSTLNDFLGSKSAFGFNQLVVLWVSFIQQSVMWGGSFVHLIYKKANVVLFMV